MRRRPLSQRIGEAEKRVDYTNATIARQRGLIAALHARGADTTLARQILNLFERSQALHVAHRDQLLHTPSPERWLDRAEQAQYSPAHSSAKTREILCCSARPPTIRWRGR